jgi:phosphatidylglycerol lysyltransferase
MRDRLARVLGPLLGVALFCAALWVLHGEFAKYDLSDVLEHLREVRAPACAAALAATGVSYLLLTGYDGLALRWVGRALGWPRVALVSFVSYAFSHNLGILSLDGSLVRYRMLSAWGLEPAEIARVVAFDAITFWLGFLFLGGALLTFAPLPVPEAWGLAATSRPLGLVLAAGFFTYLGASALRRGAPLALRGFEIALPGPRLALVQVGLSSLDWVFSAAVFWLFLPSAPGLTFPTFVGVYLLAVLGGIVSHVPGGIGVFETAMVVLLAHWLPGDVVLGAAILYRVAYYLVPLGLAVGLFGAFELRERREALGRAQLALASWTPEWVPRLVAGLCFAAGLVLLASGATPAEPGRVEALTRFLPLSVLELSHFVGSLVGMALLLLARALQRRSDAAYFAALGLLAAGAAASLLKGFDYEEALQLGAMFAALAPCRRFFTRPSALLSHSFSAGWNARVVCALAATAFLVALAYRDVDFSGELWWQFDLDSHASRSLRAREHL